MKIRNCLKFFAIFILILFSINNLNAAEKNYYQDILNDWNVSSLPTQIFVHLDETKVVKDHIIEGYDWVKLIMIYNKIIEKKND